MVLRTPLLDLVPRLGSTTATSLLVATPCLAERLAEKILAERLAGHLLPPCQRNFYPSEPCRC